MIEVISNSDNILKIGICKTPSEDSVIIAFCRVYDAWSNKDGILCSKCLFKEGKYLDIESKTEWPGFPYNIFMWIYNEELKNEIFRGKLDYV